MQLGHGLIGPSGDDGAGVDLLARIFILPVLPETGKGKEVLVLGPNAVRLFLLLPCPFPLKKAAGRDQTAVPFGRCLVGRLGEDGFGPCIDHFVADPFVLDGTAKNRFTFVCYKTEAISLCLY